MNRRNFAKAGLTAAVAGSTGLTFAAPAGSQSYYELRTYELRNDINRSGLQDFIKEHQIPMLKAAGATKVGCFSVFLGRLSPAFLVLVEYPSLSQLLSNTDHIATKNAHIEAWKKFETAADMPYVRYESVLMRAFSGHPSIEIPPPGDSKRIFELRTYESRDCFASAAKIDMFNQEEIKIFKACGFPLVFFGEGIIGPRLPHLSYMVAWDGLAAREEGWAKFGENPDWNRIKKEPKWANAVSNIYASFLRPTPFSDIK